MADTSSKTLQYVDLPPVSAWAEEFSAEEINILQTINQKVAAADSVEAVMDFVFEASRRISPGDRIGLALLQDDREVGVTAVAQSVRCDYEPVVLGKGYAESLEGSSLARVLESGKPRIINDLQAYLAENPRSLSTRMIVREGVRSSLTCPLIVEGRPVGFLFRSARRPHAYDQHQVRLVQAVAERLSQAVEKAQRIELLTRANEAYTEVLRFVSHELKSPLASMVMDGETLLGDYVGPLEDPQKEKVRSMVGRAQSLLDLIGDYLNLDRIERGGVTARIRNDVDLVAEVIDPAVEMVRPQIERKRIELERALPEEGIERGSVDPDLMRIVMVNLLGNAVRYGNEGGRIRVGIERLGAVVRFSVWNEGPGFPPGAQLSLFRKFSRIQTPELLKRRGTGVGLYTTWRIVHMHGGHIWARSEEGHWAEFLFEIPCRKL